MCRGIAQAELSRPLRVAARAIVLQARRAWKADDPDTEERMAAPHLNCWRLVILAGALACEFGSKCHSVVETHAHVRHKH